MSAAAASPLEQLAQQQLEAQQRQQRSGGRWVLVAVVLSLVVGAIAALIYAYRSRQNNNNGGGPTRLCNPPCGSGDVCVDGTCKTSAIGCTSAAQCGTCSTCTGGSCKPIPRCCGGSTCSHGQTCNTTTNTCQYVAGYCDANRPCPPGYVCDTVKNTCIAQPRYGPGTGGGGCIEGFGTWVATRDPSTGDAVWACSCVNGAIYNPKYGCSPLTNETVCTPNNLDPNVLVSASQVPAFSAFGWGNSPVLLNPSSINDPVPSPLGGGQCPCRSGWGGGTCTYDQSCSGNGRWTGANTGCACYSCSNSGGSENGATYRWTGSQCDQLADCNIVVNGGPASGQHFPENCSECAACLPGGSPNVSCSLGATERALADQEEQRRQATVQQQLAMAAPAPPEPQRFF